VTVLMAVMIVAVITVVVLLVTRWPQPGVSAPDALQLPLGVIPFAVTKGPDFWAVVSEDRRIYVFGVDGALLHEIEVPR